MNTSKTQASAIMTGKGRRGNRAVQAESGLRASEPDKLGNSYVVPGIDTVDPEKLESIVVPVAGLSPPRSPAPPTHASAHAAVRTRGIPRVAPFEAPINRVTPDVFTRLRSTMARPAGAPVSARDPHVVTPTAVLQTMTEKREAERTRFPAHLLDSIAGTTTHAVRHMSEDERKLAQHKRKLRNRESARRSRQKRQSTLVGLSGEVRALTGEVVAGLNNALAAVREGEGAAVRAARVEEEVDGIEQEMNRLREQLAEEEAVLRAGAEPK